MKTDKEKAIELINRKEFNTTEEDRVKYLAMVEKLGEKDLKEFIDILKKQEKTVKSMKKISKIIKETK